MKKEEIKELSDKELKERLEVAEKEYLQTKINHSITPLDNPSKITKDRRMIARMQSFALVSLKLSNPSETKWKREI